MLMLLISLLVSLIIGRATWNVNIPQLDNFLLVQLAQWAIFALSAGIMWWFCQPSCKVRGSWKNHALFDHCRWHAGNYQCNPWLEHVDRLTVTVAFIRAPFWVLLTAFTGAELFYQKRAAVTGWSLFLSIVLLSVLYFAFFLNRESSSTWVGVSIVLILLIGMRFRRAGIGLLVIAGLLLSFGNLSAGIWEFAGGDDAWFSTGGSRIILIQRVLEVTQSNPITGLGPAAYRPYANAEPLRYEHIFWIEPRVSSHNNYVDLYAHGGVVGLGLFFWFAFETLRVAFRLRRRSGFISIYANGMFAAWSSALVLMLFADWVLPFVYNIGFPGFQASAIYGCFSVA